MERDNVGDSMPFRMKNFTPHSDTVTWRKRLIVLFALAGIKQVRTERGAPQAAPAHAAGYIRRLESAAWRAAGKLRPCFHATTL